MSASEVQTTPEAQTTPEVQAAPEAGAVPEPPAEAAPKAKKPRAKKTGEPRKAGEPKKTPKKRGPARPYRKLTAEVLDGRIEKLQKRVTKASAQLEESKGFLVKYEREKVFRAEAEPAEA